MKYWLYFLIILSSISVLSLIGIFYLATEQQGILEDGRDRLLLQNHELLEESIFKDKEISDLQSKVQELQERLGDEIDRFDELEDRVKDSLETVETFKKLSETDPQLLQKYSKVYFLNEHYAPKSLAYIDNDYLISSKRLQIKAEVAPFLDDLLEDAEDDGIDLRILSAYRSFGTQASIKQNYVVTYGSTAANTFSADQGFSEHQLGTAVDFTTPEVGSNLSEFKNTEAYTWLQKNAYKYGFTLSYPEDNEYYIFEPWHWRFVSEDLAKYLHRNDEGFYDLDQRNLNTYLVDFFDN